MIDQPANHEPKFILGLELSELFYQEAVRPILDLEFPDLKYSAGLIGPGSEVLGLDTPQSTDHHWGPRMLLFLSENNYRNHRDRIWTVLGERLPYKFRGYSTNFAKPDKYGVQLLEEIESGPVNHRVDIWTIISFFKRYLDFDPFKEIKISDWLTFPEQKLLAITKGKIFHDDLGLNEIRREFKYYPRDVWLYLLSSQWMRIAQEEAFVGRCGDLGDELGSRIIASRLVRRLMKLCFLIEKEYAPYSKWFGTAFARLRSSERLMPIFDKVLAAESWKEREKHLSHAYEEVARLHNELKITKPMKTEVSKYYNRPYLVIHAEDFANEVKNTIRSKTVRNIKLNIGSIDQITDSTDLLAARNLNLFKRLYE